MISQINPIQAWETLQTTQNSILVDVRTKEEVDFVGFVDLEKSQNQKMIHIPWAVYPQMIVDDNFTTKLDGLIAKLFADIININLIFICRSGYRSLEAAMFMSDLGYNCCNIIGGFEGSLDHLGHRSCLDGWKFYNLPWRQK